MSGHSKWSTIKRQKGVTDIKRGLTFTKVANAITIAVKLGGSGDPESNPRLRMVMDEARGVNMPKDNIQRAIDRGLGKDGEQSLEEVLYEGFGPPAGGSKVAFIVEGVTDNKMRTLQEIKNIFDKAGGVLANKGAVSYMFERKGEIKVRGQGTVNREQEMLELIDLGAEDVEDYLDENIQKYLVYTKSLELNNVGNKITQAGYKIETQQLVYKPLSLIEIKDREQAEKVLEFTEKLEELDDVQKVYTNFDIEEKYESK